MLQAAFHPTPSSNTLSSLSLVQKLDAADKDKVTVDEDQAKVSKDDDSEEAAKQRAKDRNWKRKQKKKMKMDNWKQAAGLQ